MELLARKEVEKITSDHVHDTVIERVMEKILTAANNGEWGITHQEDNLSPLTTKVIEDTFRELGYRVVITNSSYTGSLKKVTHIRISWNGD